MTPMPSLSPIQPTPPTPQAAPRPDATPAKPTPALQGPTLTGDTLVLTPAGRARLAQPSPGMADMVPAPGMANVLPAPDDADVSLLFDTLAFEKAWNKELKPALSRWPGRDESPIAIQQIRYADLVAGGRETQYVFERDPGQLMPPMTMPFQDPQRDPITGESRVALREARLRVSAGRYDLILEVDGDGKVSFDKLFLDGKNVTRHAGDYVKAKIKEDPYVWGPVALGAAAGVVALAHNQAAKTGKPIGFDAAKFTLYQREGFEVKAKLRGELTGTSSFVRAAGAEIGTTYHDGRMAASAGLRYGVHTKSVELAANLHYQVDRRSQFSAGATYNQETKNYAVGVAYSASF